MSMHKKPLTELEREGLHLHHLPIGTPSQLSDVFRLGMAWAQKQLQAERDALAAQLVVQQGLIKEAAHDGYWDASDSNRADRWSETFDESVREQFEKYWADNELPTPTQALAEIRAEAGRAGYLQALADTAHRIDSYYATTDEQDNIAAEEYAEKIRKGGVK